MPKAFKSGGKLIIIFMNKKLLLFAVLFCIIPFLAESQNMPRWIGDNAIMGRYEIVNHGDSKYYRLYDVHTEGITIGKQQYEYNGYLEDDESIRFSFTDTEMPCNGNVRFYKYNQDIEDWQVDGEIRVGQKSFNTTSSMVVMLVLDCSGSMGVDFEEMKRSAKDFVIQLGRNSIGSGNIHMGLICFNSVKFTDAHTYDIRPIMNQNDVNYFCNKIDQLNMGNNTAMYYAMDQGYNMIENYVNGQDLKNYKSACMVTFTDGYDNHSIYQNEKPQSGVNNPYYRHINNIIRSKTIKNQKVESFVIALKGNDVREIEQSNPKFSNVFKSVLEGVASDGNEFPRKVKHFTLCENIAGVKRVFNEICESLIYSWQVLNCYCAQSHDGWVQWVVECEEVYKPLPPDIQGPVYSEKPYKFSIGVIAIKINGLSMKYFTGKRWAMQTDIGYSPITFYDHYITESLSAFMLHQTFMWEPRFVDSPGLQLHGMLGAGVGFGLIDGDFDFAPQGIAGLEFILGIPLSIQLDVRPMMPMLGDFNLGFNISARYYFK